MEVKGKGGGRDGLWAYELAGLDGIEGGSRGHILGQFVQSVKVQGKKENFLKSVEQHRAGQENGWAFVAGVLGAELV